jgi:hypothetical protein
MPFVTGLFVYPVKSLKGIEVSSAEVGAEGALTLSLAEHIHLEQTALGVLHWCTICALYHTARPACASA